MKPNSVCCTVLAASVLALSLAQDEEVRYTLVSSETAGWTDAVSRCTQLGGGLAVIENATQWNAAMKELISDVSWIGLRYDRSTTTWVWHDGSPLTFTQVQPKPLTTYWQSLFDGGTELCATAYGLSLPWDPENCSKALHFLCQDMPVPETSSEPSGNGGDSGGSRYYWVENPNYASTDSQTIMEGLLKGFGFCAGILLAACLLVQLPCCRNWATKKNILFLRRHSDGKQPQEGAKA